MSTAVMKPEDAPVVAPAAASVPQPGAIPQPSSMGAGGGGGGGDRPSFLSASLYIGDLLPEVNEGLLFEIFNAVGPVASIRVCRDAVTRRSLGYAYVNYHQAGDAERALDSMNFTEIKGKPCRIMWSQRDPSVRKSGVGNIFVKNLHEGIDNKQLYDTFSLFGNILSCKVVTDRATGMSKGYGYVHYETNEAAKSAIEKLDGMLIDGREVQVGQFMRRDNRPDAKAFTNCFVKNMPYDWDEKRLEDEFMRFGEILSVSVSMGKRKPVPPGKRVGAVAAGAEKKEGEEKEEENGAGGGKTPEAVVEDKEKKEDKPAADASADDDENKLESLGFGFVNFVNHDSAEDAVREMNEKSYTVTENGVTFDKVIYVGRAQKKAERERELRAKYETEKLDRIAKFQGTNLYVKNLDDAVTDDVLREEFGAFGTITSAHVMKEPKTGASRGFGFVCFSTPEDSTRAVNEMNGKIISGKPIFVALAQRREVRRAQLEAQHGQGRGGVVGGVGIAGGVGVGGGLGQPGMIRGMPLGGPMVGGYGPGAVPMYMPRVGPGGPGGPGGMHPSYPVGAMPQMMGGRGGYGMQVPGGQPGVRPGGGYPMQGYGMMPAQPGRGGPQGMGGPQIAGGRGGGRGPGGPAMGRGGAGGPPGPYGRGGRGPMPGQPPIKFNQQARNAVPGGMMVPSGPQPIMPDAQQPGGGPPPPSSSNEQLTPAALASATPEVQKNMIGERLYPLIHQTQPELAGKITGMLLEMDNSELLHLLESPEALNAKIQEALQVLEAHKAAEDK